jgi:hypothetical protein
MADNRTEFQIPDDDQINLIGVWNLVFKIVP